MGSQKRSGEEIKRTGTARELCQGLVLWPWRPPEEMLQKRNGGKERHQLHWASLPKDSHAQGVAEYADQGLACTVTRGHVTRYDLPNSPSSLSSVYRVYQTNDMPFELKNLTQDLQSDDVIKCLFIHMDQRFPLIVNVKSMAKCYKYSGNSCSMFIDN